MAAYSLQLLYLLLIVTTNHSALVMRDGQLKPFLHEEIIQVANPEIAALVLLTRETRARRGVEIQGFLYQVELRSGFVAEVNIPEIEFSNPDPIFEIIEPMKGLSPLE